MSAPSVKQLISVFLSILLIITLLVPAWEQKVGTALGWIFILFCLISTCYTVIWKHTKAYRQEKIARSFWIRNICVEITLILLAMIFAAIVGWYSSRVVTGGINTFSTKLIIGIGIGLLVGWAVGLFMNEVSSRLIKT